MTMSTVLTFDQYTAKLKEIKLKQEETKARLDALDADVEKGFELMMDFTYASLIYAAQGKVAYMHYCMYQVQVITEMFLSATVTAIKYRQERDAFIEETAQLGRQWNSRMFR